jgi:hypothetical protein
MKNIPTFTIKTLRIIKKTTLLVFGREIIKGSRVLINECTVGYMMIVMQDLTRMDLPEGMPIPLLIFCLFVF